MSSVAAVMTIPEIPDKRYFKIGEVAELTGVKPHVLRYWETEFPSFRLAKSRTQQRLYRRQDIELVLRLKNLLYDQGFTIAGARKKLREEKTEPVPTEPLQIDLPLSVGIERRQIEELRNDLLRLRRLLDRRF